MRKVKQWIYAIYILFPLLLLLFSMFSDGFYNDGLYTNFWSAFESSEVDSYSLLLWFMPIGSFSTQFLEPFIGANGFIPFTLNPVIGLKTICWLCDYYILLPLLYLVIRLFTFIPSILIGFMDRLKRENDK